ncbi:phenylacetate--CoA ligase family protein [Propionicimonas sp.]|uniref:phenylacetate--CoA ligase family protein n=1 Tax=Propionicimonas sp. TaxID=1955623 RepID=UPI0017C78FB2|nr:phenylacetate--CoA ligase [Propionicimonas sp.]MBU3976081.1 phenylacetate--CoA ligase [Actinomycetota bacterium]MBA3020894.1 phenylacetate--CoA ligase [Propionicimonas sp.]MBU3985271.1 phenylacetate--CoA ligase [Actinomycetota bacterium]MBU4008261.1 phenylacetate--CoA ligase [Actinomycetota bacterium]MBU4064525.1 phenylacetate--CoA ligase [Actinomycetota bacterium]
MWSEDVQTLAVAELRELQLQRLQALVALVYDRVPFYRDRLDEAGVAPTEVTSLDVLAKLPLTSKYDMREVFPFGLFASPQADIVEVHMSSGTTGKPVVGAYTRGDLEIWGEVMARTLDAGGVTSDDIVQVAYGYGLFTGGLGGHYGGTTLGAMTLPMSSGNTFRQLNTMTDFGTSALLCTPSYALFIAEYAREQGLDVAAGPLRMGFFGAEPWSEEMRADIEAKLGIKAYDIYGLTELIGPGVAAECTEQNGLHVFEDHFYPEIIDSETGEVLPAGQVGELVLTTLTRTGTPVLRYRTRDITYLIDEPCACGRSSRRIHRLMGRNDDMLIIRGVNVFPQQVEEVLLRVEGVEPYYQIVVDREGVLDTLEVEVEMAEALFSDEVKVILALERKIEHELKLALGIAAVVKLVNPKTIERSEGKAKRIVDRRTVTAGA